MNWASIDSVLREAAEAWRPPPKLSLSEWADEHFYLSPESSAQVGRWKTLPYQREIMDSLTDPRIWATYVQKSVRIGWTKICNAFIGYTIDQDPCSMLAVQPTVDDAKGYSKEEITPMIRDTPRLAKKVFEDSEEAGPRESGNTILHKRFDGGVLSMVGANSGTGFRRISRKRVLFDETDGYPASAGSDGDPIKLGMKRADYFWDRKICAGSTPKIKGSSRIESLFESGDRRRFYVPCPQCGHMDFLVFSKREAGGHYMVFDTARPRETAHYVCSKNGCVIEHHQKREMVERGEWRASAPFTGIASFHIWAAYSFSPNATWGQIAEEFIEAKGNRETLKVFVNTVLGETWAESGDVPDWERLYARRETYPIGTTPHDVELITCGVDVQQDRWEYEVVGWGRNKESWSIEAGAIPGDTSNLDDWNKKLSPMLERSFATPSGKQMIDMMAVDSGYNTQTVYNWCRQFERDHVVAVKGVAGRHMLVSAPSPVEVKTNGKRSSRAYRVWPVGVDVAKAELYGWLRIGVPLDGEPYAPGFLHFPQYDDDYFKQMTAEHRVPVKIKGGFTVMEWQLIGGRENHRLDTRVYARVAAAILGLDRLDAEEPEAPPVPPAYAQALPVEPVEPVVQDEAPDSRFSARRARGWLRRR